MAGAVGADVRAPARSPRPIEETAGVHFDIADLKLFVHIAELGNLTKGAGSAALSPSAASSRLKSLEGQLGSRLFYRESRGLALTPAGEMLLRHARVILRQFEHVRSDFSMHAAGTAGHIRIFANTTAITEVLPQVLARFMGERPEVTVDLQERTTREVVRGILDAAADIGIVAGPIGSPELESRCFSTDRLVLVTPATHPLNRWRSIAFEQSLQYPHVGLRGSTLQGFLTETVDNLDRKLTLRIAMSSFESMCMMIEAGVGVGILPESAAMRLVKGMRLNIVELSDAWAVRERRVLYRELMALPACARVFIDGLIDRSATHLPAQAENADSAGDRTSRQRRRKTDPLCS
jgi:DNA-binding transcriptional LysR family regulator